MPDNGRIRTPWKHWWRRLRYSVMPALCFVGCVALTAWLWRMQGEIPNAVASGDSVNIPIRAPVDGVLQENSFAWNRFDSVQRGELIAEFNGELLLREIAVLRAELAGLTKELGAERVRIDQDRAAWEERAERWKRAALERKQDAEFAAAELEWEAKIDELGRLHDIQREWRRLTWEVEDRELKVVDRKAEIQEDRVKLQILTHRVTYLEKYAIVISPGAIAPLVTPEQVQEAKLERNAVQTRINENTRALASAETLRDRTKKLRDDYKQKWQDILARDDSPPQGVAPGVPEYMPDQNLFGPAAVERLLAPIHAAIVAKESEIEALEVQRNSLKICSPIDGMIFARSIRPGRGPDCQDHGTAAGLCR